MKKLANIAFLDSSKGAMLSGQKTMTTHTKRMAKEGQNFRAFGATFHVVSIDREPLSLAARSYRAEGCRSMDAFIVIWNALYPIKGYDPDQLVYIHRFKRVGAKA